MLNIGRRAKRLLPSKNRRYCVRRHRLACTRLQSMYYYRTSAQVRDTSCVYLYPPEAKGKDRTKQRDKSEKTDRRAIDETLRAESLGYSSQLSDNSGRKPCGTKRRSTHVGMPVCSVVSRVYTCTRERASTCTRPVPTGWRTCDTLLLAPRRADSYQTRGCALSASRASFSATRLLSVLLLPFDSFPIRFPSALILLLVTTTSKFEGKGDNGYWS